MDVIKIIFEQFALLCCNPVLLIVLFVAAIIGFNIFTLKATTERIRTAKKAGKSNLPTLVLALPSPIWFLLALILVFLSILAVPSLNFVLLVLLIVGVLLLGPVYIFARLPDIFRYLWKLIGPFGERLLHFIESSPERLVKSYADAWDSDVTRVNLYFANHAHPRLLNDHGVRTFFRLIGLPSENLLEQYLHNPHIRHQQPVKIVHTLGKLGALPNLSRLGKDSATRDEIRAMAAAELEFRDVPEDAAIVWDALGRGSSNIFHQLQAADHLIRLKHTAQAQDILNKVTTDEDLDPRWRDKAYSLQRRLNNVSPLSGVSPVTAPTSQEPLDLLQAARTLIKDGLTQNAAEILVNLAANTDNQARIRLEAVRLMGFGKMNDTLILLLGCPDLEHTVRLQAIHELESLGNTKLALQEYVKIADGQGLPLNARFDASIALARLDQSESTRDQLCRLASDVEINYQQSMKLSSALHEAGWREEAHQVLLTLIENPATDLATKKLAQRQLDHMQSR